MLGEIHLESRERNVRVYDVLVVFLAQEKMKTTMNADLKSMLRKRGLSTMGAKPELIERLRPRLLNEAAIADQIATLGCVPSSPPESCTCTAC